MYNAWFYFFSAAVSLAYSGLTARVSTQTIAPGERLTLTVSIPNGAPGSPPVLDDTPLTSSRWKILSKDSLESKDSIQWKFELTDYLPGEIAIPAMAVQVGAGQLSTDRNVIQVVSTRDATDEKLRQYYGKLPPPIDWRLVWVVSIVLIGLSFLGWKAVRSRPLRPVPEPPTLSPEEWLRRELTTLQGVCDEEAVRLFVSLIHGYFERLEHRPTSVWTSRELMQHLTNSKIRGFYGLLLRCDSYRYHPHKEHARDLISYCLDETTRILRCHAC